ncbi:hypothetical protein D6827_02085, partial [Candidatus Parcubacteria bacterium]
MRIIKKISASVAVLLLSMAMGVYAFLPSPTMAQDISSNLDASKGDLADSDLTSLIGTLINV